MIERVDGRSKDRKTLEYIRINCVERWLDGEAPLDIIRSTGFCETTIYKWIDRYEKGGMEALTATKAPGASRKLTKEQEEELRTMIVGKNPRQYAMDFGLWTRKVVAELIKSEFGVSLGLTQVGALLARLEITPQKPLKRAYEQDPEAVQQWKEVEYPAIRKAAKKQGAEIIFLDESGFRLDDQVGRSWGKCGETPVVESTGKKSRTNSIVAASPNGAFWYEEFEGNLNSAKFCELLDRFLESRKRKVFLIVDNHPAHVSKATTEHLSRLKDKLSVHFLPGYSPELNPVEYINHYAKKEGPRKRIPKSKDELSRIVHQTLGSLKGAFKKVKSFFNHPELAYLREPIDV